MCRQGKKKHSNLFFHLYFEKLWNKYQFSNSMLLRNLQNYINDKQYGCRLEINSRPAIFYETSNISVELHDKYPMFPHIVFLSLYHRKVLVF